MSGESGGIKTARRPSGAGAERDPMTTSETMKPGTVSFEGEHATIAFERRYRHPVETVWAALTDPEHLARWYMTKARLDARTGGSIDYVSGISQFHVTGKILTWDPPRVFEHEWNVEPREYLPKGERSVIRWELTRDGEGTILRVTHRRLTRQTALGFVSGTHAFLERLEDELDGKPLRNWVKRVEELRPVYPRPW
jgi:uncharacterized protein YndB with AHSA1/START domain